MSRRSSATTMPSRPQHEQLNNLLDQEEDEEEDDFSQQTSAKESFNLISPDNATANFANFEAAFSQDDQLFEPYHDPQTNRIIMRMRMGHLMDDQLQQQQEEQEDSSIVATEAVQDQSPAWANIFDNPAFDKFSLFHTKSKEEAEDNDTPFDQVSYTDPYNPFAAFDALPSFLQTPYSFMEKAKNNLTATPTSKRTSARHKMKQKMKETRINKQGFLEESTITTVPSSNSSQSPNEELEQPYAFSKQPPQVPLQPQELRKTISSASTNDLSIATSFVKEDPPSVGMEEPAVISDDPPANDDDNVGKASPKPQRLSTERLQSPFGNAASSDSDEKKEDSASTPRRRLSKSRLESPFQKDGSPVDAPASPSASSNHSASASPKSTKAVDAPGSPNARPSPPGKLNPDRLRSPFQKEPEEEEDDNKASMSPPKRLSQSRLQSPFLQKDQDESPASPIPNRSTPPSSPLHPATSNSTATKSPTTTKEARRKVSLSPPSTPILHKVDENNATSKLDQVLESYRAMIENKSISTKEELKAIMEKEGHLSAQEITCFVFALGISLPNGGGSMTSLVSPRRRLKPAIKPSSSASDAGTATSGNSYSSQRFKARASSKSTPFDPNISHLMAQIKKENVIPSRKSRQVRSDDDAKTSISVMTSLSCRELSIQRLRRRIAVSRKQEKGEVDQLLQDLQEAQNRQKRLEQQLNQAGIQIAEDIPYAKAKQEVARIAQQMQAIGTSQATHEDPKIQAKLRQDYFVLEQEMEKYMRALELTDEYLQEQERMEQAFDDGNFELNNEALQQVWKHMPVNIRQASVEDWLNTRTPSGKYIPKPFLLKFARTNILTLLRMQPDFIVRAHPSNLENRRVTGLTLTERRALQAYLFPIAKKWRNAKDALTKRKWNWYCILRQTLKDHLLTYEHHLQQHKQLEGGLCTCNGFKCPVKANGKLDYSLDDYGYPCNLQNPEYEQAFDPAKAPKPTRKPEPAKPKPKPQMTARHSLMAELAAPKAKKPNGNKRQSLMSDIASQKAKMKARPSSLMDEIAAKAAMRQATKGLE